VSPLIIFSTVLYGPQTWSLTVSEDHTLRVFEDRVLRRTLGPNGDEVTGGWRKLPNLYSSPSMIGVNK
jgi:hypothetical protein